MRVNEVLEFLDSIKEPLYCISDVLDALETIIEPKIVAEDLDIDRHSWYTISTTVIMVDDGFIGIFGVCDIRTKYGNVEDIGIESGWCEFEAVPSITYRVKAIN